jgi:hypothetical protein
MANLYDKAGLVNIPVGYQEGFLYNIKPTDNTLAFRFNRDSAATRVNSKGLIEQVGYFGPELVTNGDFSNGTNDWETEGSSSISVGTYEGRSNVANINILNTSTSSRIRQPFNYVNGKKYKVSVDVFVVSGSFRMDSSDSFVSGDFVSTTTTGSWVTLSAEIDAISTGSNYIWLRSISQVSQFYVSNVSVTEVLGDKPRIDYTDSLTSPSFLLEPQSTNTATYSNDFTQGDIFNGSVDPILSFSVLTQNQGTAPDGTNTAQKLTDNNDGGTGSIELNYFSTTLSSGEASTVSVFVKKDTVRYFRISIENYDTDVIASFDLDTGLVNSGTGVMTNYGDGWYRCSVTITTTTDLVGAVSFAISDNPTASGGNLRNGTKSTFLWGLQAEEQSYATSYIPTAGSTATRAQETCNGAGSASTFNSTEGVLYAEIAALVNDSSVREISLSDGTANNRIELRYGAASNRLQLVARSSGSVQASISNSDYNILLNNKVAVKYKANDFALWINGVEVGTDTSGNAPSGLSELAFDDGNGTSDFYGKTKGVYVFNEALTDDELQQLTGPEYNSFAALAAACSSI